MSESHIPPPPTPDQSSDELRACIIGMAAISVMLHDLEGIVRSNVRLSQINDPVIAMPWDHFNSYRWTALQEARRGIARIMESLGDTLNGCDAVDDIQQDATEFAFSLMHWLAEGDTKEKP